MLEGVLLDMVSRLPAAAEIVVLGDADNRASKALGAYADAAEGAVRRVVTYPPIEARCGALDRVISHVDMLVVVPPIDAAETQVLFGAWLRRMARPDCHIVLFGSAVRERDYNIGGWVDPMGWWWAPTFCGGEPVDGTDPDTPMVPIVGFQCMGRLDEPEAEPVSMMNPTGGHFALDDVHLLRALKSVCDALQVEVIVETGTNEGKSTAVFAQLAPKVIGIDIDPVCLANTRGVCDEAGADNVELLQGSSQQVLADIAPSLPAAKTLYFLDAHWGEYWPLLDEIAAIPRGQGVIVMHDFDVPDRDYGYDQYGGRKLDYDYVREALTAWSPSHVVRYNREASGSRCGVAIVFPGDVPDAPGMLPQVDDIDETLPGGPDLP